MHAFLNPIWIGRFLGILCFSLAVWCLCAMGTYAPNRSRGITQLRLLSGVGLIVTAQTILIWISTKLGLVAILLLPAAFYFTVLIFRPTLAQKSRKLRIYLTGCIALSVLTLCAIYIWMIKAGIV
jgi:hypothetical protein